MRRFFEWLAEAMVSVALVLVVVGFVVLAVWLGTMNFRECRAHGFSRFYCWSSGK